MSSAPTKISESVFLAQDEAPSNETARSVVRRPLLRECVLQFGEWYVVRIFYSEKGHTQMSGLYTGLQFRRQY